MDFQSQKTELFTKAGELAREFGVETTAIIVSGDGNNVYTTSDVLTILAKSRACEPSATRRFTAERGVMQEIDAHEEGPRMFKQALSEVLDKDISSMDVNEVLVLENQLAEILQGIANRAVQIRKGQLEQISLLDQQRRQANQQSKCYVAENGTASNCVPLSSRTTSVATDNSQSGSSSSDNTSLSLSAWMQNEETPEIESGPHTELVL